MVADPAQEVEQALGQLGARVDVFDPEAERTGSVDAIVYDAASAFGDGGHVRAAGRVGARLVGDQRGCDGRADPAQASGKVVVVAPRPDAGAFAGAARAALENLTRTLSIEWARYGITATVITPGNATTDDEIAQLVCFLVSPAGDYFSGCRFSLGVTASAG